MAEPPSRATAPPDDTAEHPDWLRNLVVLSIGSFSIGFAWTLPFPFLPLIVRQMGIVERVDIWTGAITGGYFLFGLLFMPLWGGVGDHFGRKVMVLRSGWGLTAGFLALALSPGLGWFFLAFAIYGAFDGFTASAQALLVTNAPRRVLGRCMAVVQASGQIGAALGPLLGAALAPGVEALQHLYFVSVLVCGVGTGLTHWLVRERFLRERTPFRFNPVRDAAALLRGPGMMPLYFCSLAIAVSFFGSSTPAGLYTIQLTGPTEQYLGWRLETWLGLVALAIQVTSALALPLWGRLLDRFEPTRVLMLTLSLTLLALLPLPFLGTPLHLLLVRVGVGLAGAGVTPIILALLRDSAPQGMVARAVAFNTMLNMTGNALAPLAVSVISPTLGLRSYWAFNAAVMLAAVAWWRARGLRHGSI